MISTLPPGTALAGEIPDLTAELCEIPQSSADFRPAGPAPETLADLLPLVDKASRRRWNKTFKLIVEWQGKPAEEILLKHLFRRAAMDGFRPFLRDYGYLENTIVHHRKGLKHLRDLAASLGGEVETVWKEAWREVMALAKERHCLVFAEHFEAECESPNGVTVEAVNAFADELIRTRQKHKPGAKRVKNWFLAMLRECGFVKNQSTQAARQDDYGEPLEKLPEPMKSEVNDMRDWSLKTEDDSEWEMDWDSYNPAEEETYLALRRVTADKSVRSICRFYGWLKNICNKEEGINSLEDLFREKIVRSYQKWLQKVRKCEGGSMQTYFGGMFSMLKSYPKASHINLLWTTAFMKSLPKTQQKKRIAHKALRIMHYSALEAIPAKIRKDLNILIARHNKAERAAQKRTTRKEGSFSEKKLEKARATRLIRIATLAQSLLIIKYLLTLVWRNENLCECRINPDLERPTKEQLEGKKPLPNLWKGPVFPVPGLHIPKWAEEKLDDNPATHLLQFHFTEDETKAGRAVDSILPQTLIDDTVEFVNTWRKILVEGLEDPGTLFVNQAGNSMTSEQMEWATEEATLRYGGEESRSVNPHLFRDIYAAAFLLDPDHYADYLTLSKILWHECIEITVRTYSWIFNESVGTNAAGQFAEERDFKRRLREAGIKVDHARTGADRVPASPRSGYHQRQRQATRHGRK